jgi:hypothetical protein
VIKTDIEQFFDTIPRNIVKEKVHKLLRQSSLNPIIDMIVDTEINRHDQYVTKLSKMGIERGKGLRQGMPISPFLANILLADFDRQVEKRAMPMIRYADDIVLMFESEQKARDGLSYVGDLLAQLSLSLPGLGEGSKTEIVGPQDAFGFLGRKIMYSSADARYHACISKGQIGKIAHEIQCRYSLDALLKTKETFNPAIVALNTTIRTYLGIYQDAQNFPAFRARMDEVKRNVIRRLFGGLFGEDVIKRLSPEKRAFLALGLTRADDGLETVGE